MRNLHITFDYVHTVKSKLKISQIFLAFSEYMNFICSLLVLSIRIDFDMEKCQKPSSKAENFFFTEECTFVRKFAEKKGNINSD